MIEIKAEKKKIRKIRRFSFPDGFEVWTGFGIWILPSITPLGSFASCRIIGRNSCSTALKLVK